MIQLIIALCLFISGSLSYFIKRKDCYFLKMLKNKMPIIIALISMDVISTFAFVRNLGAEAEGNPIGRFVLMKFGNFGYPIMFVTSVVGLYLAFSLVYFLVEKVSMKSKDLKRKSLERGMRLWTNCLVITYSLIIIVNFLGAF